MNKIKKAFLIGLATAFIAGNVTAKPLNNFIGRKSRELYEKAGKALYEQRARNGYNVTGYVMDMRKQNGITILYVRPEKPFGIYEEGRRVGVYDKIIINVPNSEFKGGATIKTGEKYTFRIENGGPDFGKDDESYKPIPSLWALGMKESP